MHIPSTSIIFIVLAVLLLTHAALTLIAAWDFLKAQSAHEGIASLKNLVTHCLLLLATLSIASSLITPQVAAAPVITPDDQLSLLITYEMISLWLCASMISLIALWAGLTLILRRTSKNMNDETVHLQPAERS